MLRLEVEASSLGRGDLSAYGARSPQVNARCEGGKPVRRKKKGGSTEGRSPPTREKTGKGNDDGRNPKKVPKKSQF